MNLSFQKVEGFWLPISDNLFSGLIRQTRRLDSDRGLLDRVEPEMISAINKIYNACKNNNIKVGIHCLSPSYLKEKLSNGYDLATLASDVRIYAEGLSNKIKEARS